MRVEDEIGQKMLAALNKVTLGGYMEFYSPLAGLTDEKVAVRLREKTGKTTDAQQWYFDMFWFDVFIGKCNAKLSRGLLTFEVEP